MTMNAYWNVTNVLSQMKKTSGLVSQTIERLSSGKKLNRAADDPSGSANATRLSGGIRGINAAIQNAEQASLMLETMDESVSMVNETLLGMRDLAIRASNEATMTTSIRQTLQTQMSDYISEMNTLAGVANFNDKQFMIGTERVFYEKQVAGFYDIFSVDLDGKYLENLTNTPAINEATVRPSPDGAKIAFYKNNEIYTVDPDGSNEVKVTQSAGTFKFQFSWHPDSSKIAFIEFLGGAFNVNIGDVIPDSSSDEQFLGTGNGAGAQFTGTLDSRAITPGSLQIEAIDAGGGAMTVTDNGLGSLIGDVDGAGVNTINYTTGAYNVTFAAAVKDGEDVLATYDGGRTRQVTYYGIATASGQYYFPEVSPDGQKIMTMVNNDIFIFDTQNFKEEIIGTGNGVITQFTNGGNPLINRWAITPGKIVISAVSAGAGFPQMIVTDDGNGNLVGNVDPAGNNTINYDTGAVDVTFSSAVRNTRSVVLNYNMASITSSLAGNFQYARWSPDGSKVVFQSNTGLAGYEIWTMDYDPDPAVMVASMTRITDNIAQSGVNSQFPAFTLDGNYILYARGGNNIYKIAADGNYNTPIATTASTERFPVQGSIINTESFKTAFGGINELSMTFQDLRPQALGVGAVDITTQDGAAYAVDQIDKAIDRISEIQTDLGIKQLTMRYIIDDLKSQEISLADSKSRIIDADMAEEITRLTKAQLVQEASLSALVQANDSQKSALNLLNGSDIFSLFKNL